MKKDWRNGRVILGLLCLTAANVIVGCEVRAHGRFDEVDIVDDHGYRHHGYYDDHHDWHGGYYDERHEFHDDDRGWHH